MRRIGALLAVAIGLGAGIARAEALNALVNREEGVEFGPCALTPKPKLAGDVHLVIPARFGTPGSWVTRTILLVGIDGAKTVQGTLEFKAAHDIPPREVIGVTCKRDRIAIRLKGKAERKAGARKQRRPPRGRAFHRHTRYPVSLIQESRHALTTRPPALRPRSRAPRRGGRDHAGRRGRSLRRRDFGARG